MEIQEKELEKLDIFVLLGDFLRQAKRLWLLLLAFGLVCGTALPLYARSTYRPSYEAYASFTVRVSNPMYANVSSYNERTAQIMQDTFPSILTSDLLRNRVKEELGLSTVPSLSVSASAQASILTLTVRDSDPQRAYDVLNAMIRCYPEVSEFVVGSTVLVLLDESGLPTAPVSGFSFRQHAVRGAVIGVALWGLLVAALCLLKNTVHNEDELRAILNTPCLGQIPTVKTTKKTPYPLVFNQKNRGGFQESLRLLRLRLEKEMAASGKKVLLVSSAIPGEGKTTVAVNLAASLAQKGKTVLLLDCDLRNPSVAKALSTKTHPLSARFSLSQILSGEVKVGDAIQRTALECLHVISGGSDDRAHNAALLSQERMALLIGAAREQYDYVILDTPPCSMLSDASELAELAECGLMVIRQDYASRDQILDGVQRLSDSKLPLIGCALSNVRRTLSGGYDYGYSYGYGYGKNS